MRTTSLVSLVLVLSIWSCDDSTRDTPSFTGAGASDSSTMSSASGEGASSSAYDCEFDSDCTSGTCIEVLDGGFKTCLSPVSPATGCTASNEDECCTTADCNEGSCVFYDYGAWVGPAQPDPHNLCLDDQCTANSDCETDEICVAAGVLGQTVGTCFRASCSRDEDCTDQPGGICGPMEETCSEHLRSFRCIYPGDCRKNSDCSDAEPPFLPGERYCDSGECTEISMGAWCDG